MSRARKASIWLVSTSIGCLVVACGQPKGQVEKVTEAQVQKAIQENNFKSLLKASSVGSFASIPEPLLNDAIINRLEANDLATIEQLHRRGVSLNLKVNPGQILPLGWAVKNEHDEAINLLLRENASLEYNPYGAGAIGQASTPRMFNRLADLGARRATGHQGWSTSLVARAIRAGDSKTVSRFAGEEISLDPPPPAKLGQEIVTQLGAYYLARNNPHMVQFLRNRRVSSNSLMYWTDKRFGPKVQLIGAPVIFMLKNLKSLELIFPGTDPELVGSTQPLNPTRELDPNARTPLMYAATGMDTPPYLGSKLLIRRGAKLETKDKSGRTALYWAVLERNLPYVQFLIRMKADVNTVDEYGWSPLFRAVTRNDVLMAQTLMRAGALTRIVTENGESPISLAKALGHLKLAALMEANPK